MSISAVFQILGGLGVFLYGLRIMSQALQRVAGDKMRAVLRTMTRNRFTGVVSGFAITAGVQSSSATTVLVVSFANAGLLTLIQAIGLVMGANIGTTVTGWLVALLGFKVKIAKFALPLIGIAFPVSLLSSRKAKDISDVFVGFGLLFLGLAFLKEGVPDLKSNPEALEFVRNFANYGFLSTVLFVLVGSALTVIVQSSSASMAITLAMAAKGWIGFDIAAAMVLGENIGTTITAQLAAIGASRNAKRVAMSHTVFNVLGVLWMLPIMGLYLGLVDSIIPGDPWAVATGDDAGALAYAAAVTAHLAAFHTAFNLTNTAVMIGFTRRIADLVTWMVPVEDHELTDRPKLAFLEQGLVDIHELGAASARKGLRNMLDVTLEMGELIDSLVSDHNVDVEKVRLRVAEHEDTLDAMEEEIVEYCGRLAREETSDALANDLARYIEIATNIEEIGDYWRNLGTQIRKRADGGKKFDDEARAALGSAIAKARIMLSKLQDKMESAEPPDVAAIKALSKDIIKVRRDARRHAAERMRQGDLKVRTGLMYMDLAAMLEELSHCAKDVAIRTAELETAWTG